MLLVAFPVVDATAIVRLCLPQ